jgi:hypothetical protein
MPSDPDDEPSRKSLNTFLAELYGEFNKEAQTGQLEFTYPLEVAEALEPLGELSWTHVCEAIQAQAIGELIEDTFRLIEQGDSFTWPLEGPRRCLAIVLFAKYTRRVRRKYGFSDCEQDDDRDPADWWKEAE